MAAVGKINVDVKVAAASTEEIKAFTAPGIVTQAKYFYHVRIDEQEVTVGFQTLDEMLQFIDERI